MRYAVISDIHSNLEALRAVIEECQKLDINRVVCGGDIVGYGADPNECLRIISKIKASVVAGNHDWAVSGRLDASYFTDDGKEAILWTRNQISMEVIQLLSNLQLVYKNNDLILVHGTLNNPESFHYLTQIAKGTETFELMDKPVCFLGHTHEPKIFIQSKGNVYDSPNCEVEVEPRNKYIVNVGSVGQPRDGNPLASFCIYDTKARMIEIRRVQYDIQSAQKKIIAAGLPEALAQRLSVGQ